MMAQRKHPAEIEIDLDVLKAEFCVKIETLYGLSDGSIRLRNYAHIQIQKVDKQVNVT